MRNTVVVHFHDGKLLKGYTSDFFPNKPSFHLQESENGDSAEVKIAGLKGVFFVKSFDGDAQRTNRNDVERTGLGRKIQVDFSDGETLIGYTSGYSPGRPSFFVFPADPEDNNERVFIVTTATKAVKFL